VTLRVLPHVWNLRSHRALRVIAPRIARANGVGDLRVTHFSIQGNHLHLLVEAAGPEALGRGMKGLAVRLARGLNRLMSRRGAVFADHYHSHVLYSLAEVRRALAYLRGNFASHAARAGRRAPPGPDPFSSDGQDGAEVVLPARCWLMRKAGGS
jgi:REP element-mobilizing transposase RayT